MEINSVKIKKTKVDQVIIPSLIKEEIDYMENTSWLYKVVTSEKEETWVLGRCCIADAEWYLEQIKEIKSFDWIGAVDINIDQIRAQEGYVQFKKDKPKGKYTYAAYVIDTDKNEILYNLFYADNNKEAPKVASKMAQELGYKKPPLKDLKHGFEYRTKSNKKLTKYYTPYEIKIGFSRI